MATWVVGDIHGCYDTFQALLKNPEIEEADTIILIGDIIDRGPDSYKMIKWAMDNVTENGKYQMILGNHEDNIIQDLRDCKHHYEIHQKEKSHYMRLYPDDIDYLNKEYPTWDNLSISALNCHYDFIQYMEEAGFKTVESVVPIIKWFGELPLCKKLTIPAQDGTYQNYIIAHAWYNEREDRDTILWDRDVDYGGSLTADYNSVNGEILIHGHTPTIAICKCQERPYNEVLFRKNSINIDCGCVFSKYGGNLAAIRLEDKHVIYGREQMKITY